MAHNPNCDGERCKLANSEVRKLPMGDGGNLILCQRCYAHEMTYRRYRNVGLDKNCQFDTPSWERLETVST